MKILIIDNYDSFTHNLAHVFRELDVEVTIKRNDAFSLNEPLGYDKIVLSPGAGIPREAGQLLSVIEHYAPTKPILGVCLGHQAIGEYFGAQLMNLPHVYHGVESTLRVTVPDRLFAGLGSSLTVGRYHSWVVSPDGFPPELEVTAVDSSTGQIMALRHRRFDVCGVQFHPESVLTPEGKSILRNWVLLPFGGATQSEL